MQQYDLVVIGSGPGGQRAAIQAAKAGKRVAVVEKQSVVGGVEPVRLKSAARDFSEVPARAFEKTHL